jgi:hypothetical protein
VWLQSEETSHVKCTQTLKKNTTLPAATVTVSMLIENNRKTKQMHEL